MMKRMTDEGSITTSSSQIMKHITYDIKKVITITELMSVRDGELTEVLLRLCNSPAVDDVCLQAHQNHVLNVLQHDRTRLVEHQKENHARLLRLLQVVQYLCLINDPLTLHSSSWRE